MTRIQDTATQSSLYITATDDVTANSNIVLAPKGTGIWVRVTGQFTVSDGSFILEDAQGPKARFLKLVMLALDLLLESLPCLRFYLEKTTTIVGDDTSQTLRNKTIFVDEDNLVITDGDEEAVFQINWGTTSGTRRSYGLPDAGPVTTTFVTHSNIIYTSRYQNSSDSIVQEVC